MNPQQFSSPPLGQPPRPSAFARFIEVAPGFAANALVVGALVLGAENLFAHEYRPSSLIDCFISNCEQPETPAKQLSPKELSDLADAICLAMMQSMPDHPAAQQACEAAPKTREEILRERAGAARQGGSVLPRAPDHATIYLLQQ